MKKYFVFVNETATQMQILRTAYDKKPVRETWRTPFIHYSPYTIFLSFLEKNVFSSDQMPVPVRLKIQISYRSKIREAIKNIKNKNKIIPELTVNMATFIICDDRHTSLRAI